jgi:hypothetical protein
VQQVFLFIKVVFDLSKAFFYPGPWLFSPPKNGWIMVDSGLMLLWTANTEPLLHTTLVNAKESETGPGIYFL